MDTMVKRAVTHNGSFHADDVFSAVVLMKIFPKLKIRRTRDKEEIAKAYIVFDIGRIYDPDKLRFDHHQPEAPKRKNGIFYSSFGQIWQKYGVEYCGDAETAQIIDKKFVQLVDTADSGISVSNNCFDDISPMNIDDIITIFEPVNFSDKKESAETQFKKAIDWATTFLERMVIKTKDDIERAKYVKEKVSNSPDERYVVLDETVFYDAMGVDFPKLLYAVYPNKANDTWSVRALRKSEDDFTPKQPMPEQWAGKIEQDLVEITGVKDALFAHNNRFIAVAGSRDGALSLLKKALK